MGDDELDEFNTLMSKISESEQQHDLELSSVTDLALSSHRVNSTSEQAAASARTTSPRGADSQSLQKLSPRVAALDQVMNTINGRSRNMMASHGENDLNLASADVTAVSSSGKATKLNSIANNMTTQARYGAANRKTLEHSVKNIKPKTPVNHVNSKSGNNFKASTNVTSSSSGGGVSFSRQHSRTSNPDSVLDRQRHSVNLARRREMSAIRIQRFYRRHVKRKRSGEAALKRMLEAKRRDLDVVGTAQYDPAGAEANKDVERKRIREEKASQARQQAIQVSSSSGSNVVAITELCSFDTVPTTAHLHVVR